MADHVLVAGRWGEDVEALVVGGDLAGLLNLFTALQAKTQASRVPPLYPLTRAREGRADLSAVGQQRDPLAPGVARSKTMVRA